MAIAKYGKGTVFAMTDPWLYNEYTDGLKLPPEYQNDQGGQELAHGCSRKRTPTPRVALARDGQNEKNVLCQRDCNGRVAFDIRIRPSKTS